MTKEEAIQAMKEGRKVRHGHFGEEEYMISNLSGTRYSFEDGNTCSKEEFWKYRSEESFDNDWELYPEITF